LYIGLIWLRIGTGEHGNEPSGSMKDGEFLDQLSVLLAPQDELCSMELVGTVESEVYWRLDM
jgi:hypothetical protein